MGKAWSAWPQTKLGWVSLSLTGGTLLIWFSLPVFVQLMNRFDFDRVFGLAFVVILLALSLTALVLSWYSFGARKDKSVMLLIAACVISATLLLAAVGEVIEALMMSANVG